MVDRRAGLTAGATASDFYLPRNTSYGIMASVMDAARYAVTASARCEFGCNALSFLTDVNAKPVRSAGRFVQGIGYCADSAFGALALRNLGDFAGRAELIATADDLTTHIFQTGYLADPDIPVRLYRDAESGEFFDQVEARSEYFDLGHMARPLEKLLDQSRSLTGDQLATLHGVALRLADWIVGAERTSQGWLPRRLDEQRKIFRGVRKPAELSAGARSRFPLRDHALERSGAGLLAVSFLLRLHQHRLRPVTEPVTELCESFVEHGGFFGSINTDTEDLHESVAYAIGFQVLLEASKILDRPAYRDFAYDVCLAGLRAFHIDSDLNGQPTKGLTRLAANYSSACFWENAEVALAYCQAAQDSGSSAHARDGMTILRACARNRFAATGFLPAELDWDGRMPAEKHIDSAERGPRFVTHPYMNNLNLLAPTLFYLRQLAWRSGTNQHVFHDLEGVQLWPV